MLKKKGIFKGSLLTVITVISILGLVGCGGADTTAQKKDDSKPAASAPAETTAKKEEPKKAETKITYDNFMKIKMGDKYENVVALIGEGKEETSSEAGGIKIVMYKWDTDGMANMSVTVQNGVVQDKAQIGLLLVDNNITLDKYNQTKEGMGYDEVKNVLGEGQIISQGKIQDIETIIYCWTNKDGSNANFTFSNGKLQMKAQAGLK